MTTKRRRKQIGYLYKASGVWYVRHHDDRIEKDPETHVPKLVRKQVSTRIGTVAEFTKEMAREEAKKLLAPINDSAQKPEAVQPLSQFVEQTFFPFMTTQVRPSTLHGFKARWRQLMPWCGELRLRDTMPNDIQQVLAAIHKQGNLKRSSIRSLRYLLKIIFDHAIVSVPLHNTINPVLATKVPKSPNEPLDDDTPKYSIDVVTKMLAVLPEPARTAVAAAAFTGARRGEIAGMLWDNFDPRKGMMRITQSVWEGHVGSPKTRKSKAPVPIIRPLVLMLEAHRILAGRERKTEPPTTGPIFASSEGTPLNMNNLLNRQILPVLNRCGVCHKPKGECEGPTHKYKRDESLPEWQGWHGFRRGLATNLQGLGVDLKTTQEILRHAQISTTANLYIGEVSAQSKAAMKRLERVILKYDLPNQKPLIVQ